MSFTGAKRVSHLSGCQPTSCALRKTPVTLPQGGATAVPCVPATDLDATEKLLGMPGDGPPESEVLLMLERLSGVVAFSELALKAALLELRRLDAKVKSMLADSVHLERLAFEDSLTGLPNRRRLERTLIGGLAEMSSSGAPISIAFVDVDRFKQINDSFSHAVGDRVLVAIAGILKGHIRPVDTACRLAGDEFVVIFGRADRRMAQRAWARVAKAIADYGWSDIAPGLSVTVSAGIAAARTGDDLAALLMRSDGSMYAAKRRGVPVR